MNASTRYLTFDVMLDGRYIHTFHMPSVCADSISPDGKLVVSAETIQSFVERRLPSLKNKPYTICF